ncbi:MAG TPA: hypothetical protein PKE32_09440 [Miltoncostaeaceae bacterium]|nr:hypothetical protein [Miltoncostaeaceae bacterium]
MKRLVGVYTPLSSASPATTTLKVDPGASRLAVTRFTSGESGWEATRSNRPSAISCRLKVGDEAAARIAPVRGSRAITAPF